MVSWDFHQVLDEFRNSAQRFEEWSYYKLPEQVIEQLERVERTPEAAQIVLSFCHIQDTTSSGTVAHNRSSVGC